MDSGQAAREEALSPPLRTWKSREKGRIAFGIRDFVML